MGTFSCNYWFVKIVDTYGFAMALKMNDVLVENGFNVTIMAYVKDEESNLSTMINVLTYVVPCECWGYQHCFWVVVGGKPCLNVINMQQMMHTLVMG